MRVNDKIEEARFFLEEIKKNKKSIPKLRYYINSFIVSWRSVTFVLQKQYKAIYGKAFEEWYEKKAKMLRALPQAKALLNMRNVIQKEGNRLPIYQIEWDDPENQLDSIIASYDPSIKEITRIEMNINKDNPNAVSRFPKPIPINKVENHKEEIDNAFLSSASRIIPKVAINFEKFTRGGTYLVVDDDGTVLGLEEFINMLETHLTELSSIANEANNAFKKEINSIFEE